jgi:hypothetical protein
MNDRVIMQNIYVCISHSQTHTHTHLQSYFLSVSLCFSGAFVACACMYVCMYVCVCKRESVYMNNESWKQHSPGLFTNINHTPKRTAHSFIHTHMHIIHTHYIYTHACMQIHTLLHTHSLHTHAHMNIHIHTRAHTHYPTRAHSLP